MLSIFLLLVGVVLFVLLLKEKVRSDNLEAEKNRARYQVEELEKQIQCTDHLQVWKDHMLDNFIRYEVVQKLPGFQGNFKEWHSDSGCIRIVSTTDKSIGVVVHQKRNIPTDPKELFTWVDEDEAIIACGGTPKSKGNTEKPLAGKRRPVYDDEEGKVVWTNVEQEKPKEEPKSEQENVNPAADNEDPSEAALHEFYQEFDNKLLAMFMEDRDGHFCFDIPDHLADKKDRIWEHATKNGYIVGENNTDEPGQYVVLWGGDN